MPTVDPTLESLLLQTCDVQQLQRDPEGNMAVLTSYIGQPCNVEFNNLTVVDSSGERAVSKAQLFLGPVVVIDHTWPNWRVLIDGKDYEVLQVQPIRDKMLNELHHYELMLR